MGRLAEGIKRDGRHLAVEILPSGTIIDGHQRCRASLTLGLETMMVIIRYDLDCDEAAMGRRSIAANRDRCQRDTLDEVRVARRVAELKTRQQDGAPSHVFGRIVTRLAESKVLRIRATLDSEVSGS